MSEVGSVEFKAVLDTKSLPQQVEQAQKLIAGKDANLKVGADTTKARDEFGRFIKQGQQGVKTPVDADTSLAKQKLKELGDFAKKALGEVGRGIGQGIGINLANSIQGTVAGAVGSVTGTVKEGLDTFIAFQDKLTTFGAVANATKEETKALADEAKRLGIETSKTPVQVGEAAVQLAKLGFSAKDTKEQVEGVVRLSEASGLADLGKAAEVAGAAFNVFGVGTKKTADIVAAAANATAADAQDLLQAISSAGGVAKANNQSFETLAATFGLLRSAGFQAEAAGTGVKTLISNLAAPTSAEAKQGLEQLGVSVFDTSGKMRNLKDLLPEFRKALSGLTEQRQAGLTKAIFGDSGAPAFLALLSTAQSKIDDTFNTINTAESSNAAGEAAKKLLTGLPGQLKLLEGSVATLKLNLGEAIAPAFEGLAKLGTDTANEVLKSSGLLDGLKSSAEGFKATLEQDPELAKELAAALGEAGKVLADEVAGGARSLTDYLKENPKAIAELVSGTVEFVKLLGQAVEFAGKVVDKLGEGAQRLKGLLNPDAGDKEGTEKAIKGSGGTKADADAVEQRTQARVRRQSLTTDIGGVPITFGSIKPQEIEKIRAEEAQKQLDEVRKRNQEAAAKTPAGTASPEDFQKQAAAKANAARASFKVGGATGEGTDASEKTASGQLKGIEDFSRDLTLKENKLSESADNEITLAKKAQLARTKTAQETEAAIAGIQAKESQGKVKAIQESIAQIDAAEKTGQIGAKEAATKRSELQKKLASAEKSDLENQIKARDAANRVILENEERRVKAQQALIARTEFAGTQGIRTTDITAKEAQFQGTGGVRAVGQDETVQLQTLAVQKSASVQKIALLQTELQKNQELRQSGVRNAKEATEKELQLEEQLRQEQGRLTDNRSQVLEAQQKRELALIQARVDAQKRASQAVIAEFDREKQAQENLSQTINRVGKLIESQGNLSKAVSDSRQSVLQQRVERANESIESAKQLSSGETGPALRQVLQRQLGSSVGVGDQSQTIALLKNRQALEVEADREKVAALQQQEQLDRVGLQLDLARQQIAAETAVLEAKRSEQLAKQNELEAQGNVLKAQRTGNAAEVDNARQSADLARQGADLARQGVDNAQKNLGIQDQLRQNAEATLAVKQKTTEEELNSGNAAKARGRERELASAFDSAAKGNGATAGGSGGSGGGLSEAPGNKIDRQLQLEFAKAGEAGKLQKQFEQEDQQAARRKKLEEEERAKAARNGPAEGAVVQTNYADDGKGGKVVSGTSTVTQAVTKQAVTLGAPDPRAIAASSVPTTNPTAIAAQQSSGENLLKQITSDLGNRFDALAKAILAATGRPNLTVMSAQPVADAAAISASISKNQVGAAGL